jgi:cell division protease FtsH
MVAIIEGRDPALVEGAYTSTRAKPKLEGDIEPPARHVHIIDEPIPMPAHDEDGEESPAPEGEKPPEGEDPEQTE